MSQADIVSSADASHAAWAPLAASAAALSLSAEQRACWSRDGFLALRAFCSPPVLAGARAALARVLADVERVPRGQRFYETRGDASTLKQVLALHTHSPALAELARSGAPAALAAALLGPAPVLQNLQFFSKPPGGHAAPTPPHQDSAYFCLRDPADAVTLWLALDDVDEENGGVCYVAGSHRAGLLPHVPTGVLGFSRGIVAGEALAAAGEPVVQCAAPGDLLVHHGLTIHSAGANRSADRPRRALGFIYYSKDAEVDEDAKAEYEARLRGSLLAAGRI